MNPLQRAATIRKASYLAAILVLFTVSMVWRGVIPVPLGNSAVQAAAPFRWAHNHTIQSQAQRLEVWELDPNETEADLTGSAARLVLTGTRGFAVTITWLSAIDKQKRNDFHEFEDRVRIVTKLQPNFITPWIYQSWNIAYNVSVEMHGTGDMYYYIVRGIQLLAEGEQRNKRSPDMRYQIAFYYQNKFGVSDQVETLRCLFDLSCMPPSERNPDNLEKRNPANPELKEVDPVAFRRFCERHPHFVRRLRGEEGTNLDKFAKEKLRAPTPQDVVAFLRANYKELPSRYRKDKNGELTDDLPDAEREYRPLDYFPALPPKFPEGEGEWHPGIATPDDYAGGAGYFSAYKAARAWFAYSLPLLPLNARDERGDPIPSPTPPPGARDPSNPERLLHDPSKHRVPRLPIMIIFRQGAPRAQSYQAELEQKEGWFDADGWRIDDPANTPDKWWFPDPELSRGRPLDVVVGREKAWSFEEWRAAAQMWKQHGREYALDSDALVRLEKAAGESGDLPLDPSAAQRADPELRRRYEALNAIQYYRTNRQVTNFPYFLATAEAESRVTVNAEGKAESKTVLARKTLWQAEQARKIGRPEKAIPLYKKGLEKWKEVLTENPNFHRMPPPDRGDRGEEETYEFELAYFRLLVQYDERVRDRANALAHATHGLVPFLTAPFPKGAAGDRADPLWPDRNKEEIKWVVAETTSAKDFEHIKDPAEREKADFSSPFVGTLTPKGELWVREEVKEQVRTKQGVSRGPQQPAGQEPNPAGGVGGAPPLPPGVPPPAPSKQ